MHRLRAAAFVLLNGLGMVYFSEWMFWAGRPLGESLVGDVTATWLLYSTITYLFLAAVDGFRARSVWAVFLCGALYGWLVEGVIVPTMYTDFPLNLSWTGLAWHALITVVFGWYWLPLALRHGGQSAVRATAGFGLFAGLWALGWKVETPLAAPGTMAVYFALFALMPCAALLARARLPDPALGKRGVVLTAGIALVTLYFVGITLPQVPFAPVVLLPLLVILLSALWRNRQQEAAAPDAPLAPPLMLRQLWPMMLIPLVASAVYALGYASGVVLPTLLIVFVVLTPAGFVLFGLSLYRVWKRPLAVPAALPTP